MASRPENRELIAEIHLLPNLISFLRIVLILPILLLFGEETRASYFIVLGLLTVSYLSDYLDGLAARRLKLQSRLGLILDPLADKLWTLAMIYLLVQYRDLPLWVAAVIIGRDVCILLLNVWILKKGHFVLSSDELGRKYMVLLGLMVIAMTAKLPYAVWISYGLIILAPVIVIRYAIRYYRVIQTAPSGGAQTAG